jgi:hypothetical protein
MRGKGVGGGGGGLEGLWVGLEVGMFMKLGESPYEGHHFFLEAAFFPALAAPLTIFLVFGALAVLVDLTTLAFLGGATFFGLLPLAGAGEAATATAATGAAAAGAGLAATLSALAGVAAFLGVVVFVGAFLAGFLGDFVKK